VGLQTAMAAAPSPWTGFVGWLIGAAASGGARVAYANRRKEPDAKVAILQSQKQLIDVKTLTQMHKAEAAMHKAALDQLKLQLAIAAAQPIPEQRHGLSYSPALRGDESSQETALMYALTPGHWADQAPVRGLEGTTVQRCRLTDAGVELDVRLDGRWDVDKLARCEGQIRALASIETATRVHIGAGDRGDVARVLIRTRSASDGLSMDWTPGREGIGVDEITGELVDIPLKPGLHILAAGATGMGKSTAWRPFVARAMARPDWAAVVIDPKRQEAVQWCGKCRTVGNQGGSNDEIRQAIYDTLVELVLEMQHRQSIATTAVWVPSAEYPYLFLVIDEGRQLIEMARDRRWADTLTMLDDLYTLSRAVGFQILWATQYPSRTNGGITAIVDENTTATIALTVSGQTADRVVFGESAAELGWEPSKLDGIVGRSLVKYSGRKGNPVRLFHVSDDAVRALPDRPGWHTRVQPSDAPLVDFDASPEDRVRAFLDANPDASHSVIAAGTGIPKGSISSIMRRL